MIKKIKVQFKPIVSFLFIFFIYIRHGFAYNPTQQAMEDLSDSEGYSRNSPFGDFIVYIFLIGLGLAFLVSSFKAKVEVSKFIFQLVFFGLGVPFFIFFISKEILGNDWKILAVPLLLIILWKFDSIVKLFSRDSDLDDKK
jgi:hypothetical protein